MDAQTRNLQVEITVINILVKYPVVTIKKVTAGIIVTLTHVAILVAIAEMWIVGDIVLNTLALPLDA